MNSTYPALTHRRSRVARGGTLVLGGGFAGSYVARQVGKSGATIVNPTNFMLYTPLLPEAAAGSVEPRHVTVPLRTMCPHADLVLGSAVALDPQRRVVTVDSEAGTIEIAYADLVVALGAISAMPDLPGLREHALALKDLADAIRLRNHVLRQIELADAVPETAARRLTFVLAGAGFAGVEAVAELNELVSGRPARAIRGSSDVQPRWVLVEGGPRILRQTPESLARFAARTLGERGVEILTETTLASVDAGGRHALRRAPHRDRDGRLDGRRHAEPAARRARTAARQAWARAGRRDAPGGRLVAHLGARRLRRRAERGHTRRDRPGHLPARAPPGAPAGATTWAGRRAPTATARAARWRRSAAAMASRSWAACA